MTADPPRAGGTDFAALLHQRRRAAGLTQADLARLAGLAVRTVRDVERGRTSRVQRTTAVLLANALGLAGEDRSVFLSAARGEGGAGRGGAPGTSLVSRPGAAAVRGVPLPPAPILLGRDQDLARLAELIAGVEGPSAPVSLVGVGGVGKSALALALGHRVGYRFPGGVAGIVVDRDSTASDVVDAIGSVFGVPRPDELPARFAAGPALLLVDAVDRAPGEVRRALVGLPAAVRVVTTGRRPLGLPGERVWPVAPLALPPADVAVELAEVARYPAAALLLNRLGRVRQEPLGADEVPALVGLVRRLGGLPLALELVASHGRLLRLPELLRRYGERALDLRPEAGGEQSLREAVAGSYRLLSAFEQLALRRLSAFRNRWSVELAEQLLGEEPAVTGLEDPVPLLDLLVSLGLVGVRGVRENRFRLLDVVRDFATEQAERHGELAAGRRAHAVVVARLAARVGADLAGVPAPLSAGRAEDRAAAAARLDDLAAELWSALNYAAGDDPPTALRLASSLVGWWRFRGRGAVGHSWLQRLLSDPRCSGVDRLVRAWAQLGLAQLAVEQGRGAAEARFAEEALAEFRSSGEVAGELAAGVVLGQVAWAEGRYPAARSYAEAVLVAATRTGRLREASAAQYSLLWHEVQAGDLAAARRRLAAVDRIAAQSGEQRLRILAAVNLAEVARWEGRFEEALAIGGRVLARLSELGDPAHRRQVLGTLGRAYAALGRAAEAERVLSALRAEVATGSRLALTEGVCAAIEGRLALGRGDRERAEVAFAAAAAAFREAVGPHDLMAPREVVEALVGLAVAADPAVREWVLGELREVTGPEGFAVLPAERALLAAVGVDLSGVPKQRCGGRSA